MDYQLLVAQHIPPCVSKVRYFAHTENRRYRSLRLSDGTFSLRLPIPTDEITVAICFHEISHALHKDESLILTYMMSIGESIRRNSEVLDEEARAWETAKNELAEHNIPITKELRDYIDECLLSYILYIICVAFEGIALKELNNEKL